MKHYNYIFAGAGLSSLLVVYEMIRSGRFQDKSILLIDSDTKKANDRTWCFWEKGSGQWDNIVSKEWNTALFIDSNFRKKLDFGGYQYKMIQGLDFYIYVFAEIKKHINIKFLNAAVTNFADSGFNVLVKTDAGNFTCNKLFNNIYNPKLPAGQNKYPVLQQHFLGWHVKTTMPAFNDTEATFMDFSVPQKGNTRFMYVLPVSGTEALVEYTLFSKDLLPLSEYEDAIKEYLQQHNITGYKITATEKGSIPMTVYPFWKSNTKNILHIGSAGGWTKASTGYTFKSSTKKAEGLVHFLQGYDDFTQFYKKNKFWYYDLLLLDILGRHNRLGSLIFSGMFKSGEAGLIFKFLDEDTSLSEDLQVILKCPKLPFIKALLRRVLHL